MKNRVICVITFLCLIMLQSIGFAQHIQSPEDVQDTASYYLSALTTEKTVDTKLFASVKEKFKSIEGAEQINELQDVYTFYDLNNIPTAYVFTTISGDTIGHIAISATTELLPLLNGSSNSHPMKNFDKCLEIACEEDPTICENPSDYAPVYLGLFYYYFVFKPNAETPVVVEAVSQSVVPYEVLNSMQRKYNRGKKRCASIAAKRWQDLKNLSEANSVFKAGKNIDVVPDYLWYRGCTTTASTMILSYWGLSKGYSGFNEQPYAFDWTQPTDLNFWGTKYNGCKSSATSYKLPRNLADELANAMSLSYDCGQSRTFGASSYNQVSAMGKVAKNHGYSFKATRITGQKSINTYMSEIDYDRPVIINCNIGAIATKKGGSHSNAGYGYNKISETECVLYLRNTAAGRDNGAWNTYFTYQNAYKLGYMSDFIIFVPY